jgi:hypothetical protein
VNSLATEADLKAQDFACTLLAAVIGQNQSVFFQLGDGAMVQSLAGEKDLYHCICWPQQGEYANSTNFLTDADAKEKFFLEVKAGT